MALIWTAEFQVEGPLRVAFMAEDPVPVLAASAVLLDISEVCFAALHHIAY